MEEQHRHEISQRMRRLRDDSEETNRSIADAVGVGERTVAGWLSPQKPTGISYTNAKKVAELFQVNVDWLWRGRERGEAPDLFGKGNGDQLDRIEALLNELLGRLDLDDAQQAADAIGQRNDEETPPSEAGRRAARDS